MASMEWLPLESNPDIMNNFLKNLGVPTKWKIFDIVSLDEELLGMVPSPVYSVLLLFPFSEADNQYCKKQEDIAKSKPQEMDPKLYFMQQTISNGCGIVALIHAIANNIDKLNLESDSVIKKFIEETKTLTPIDKSKTLESNYEICQALKNSYEDGRSLCNRCIFHFIALTQMNSMLYELDGRKIAPVIHGPTSRESFLKDAARVCKEYMKRDPENVNFTALAFCAGTE
ncbi:ubiquitin carboxyl-terminal hydrolase isozyme L3 [Trichonephila clavata]|uniref:Ubiquitin carboxyl-terminal hydrolase n=1 Tax=Trichonephila clavata TaxID=2740835 RepID=A0A8X6GXN8_TRICU|nr:ubiquitin carboxyl-terminal hydrolase isozyme L3 [Trichonephila clavata]